MLKEELDLLRGRIECERTKLEDFLVRHIAGTVKKFSEETGLLVENIAVRTHRVESIDGRVDRVVTDIEVKFDGEI